MKRNTGNAMFISVMILALASAGALYYTRQTRKPYSTPEVINSKQSLQPETNSPAAASPTAPVYSDPNVKTFTSADLGIRFSYLEKQQNPGVIGTKQIGNKVFVYDMTYSADQGQYVEVFTKSDSDTLTQAVTKQFLKGYPPADCFAETINDPVAKQQHPASFVFAHITFPKGPNDGMEEFSVKSEKCPKSYTETNGIAYFLADSAHATQFAFFSIGQYAISGPNNTTWQNTIQFLK